MSTSLQFGGVYHICRGGVAGSHDNSMFKLLNIQVTCLCISKLFFRREQGQLGIQTAQLLLERVGRVTPPQIGVIIADITFFNAIGT